MLVLGNVWARFDLVLVMWHGGLGGNHDFGVTYISMIASDFLYVTCFVAW